MFFVTHAILRKVSQTGSVNAVAVRFNKSILDGNMPYQEFAKTVHNALRLPFEADLGDEKRWKASVFKTTELPPFFIPGLRSGWTSKAQLMEWIHIELNHHWAVVTKCIKKGSSISGRPFATEMEQKLLALIDTINHNIDRNKGEVDFLEAVEKDILRFKAALALLISGFSQKDAVSFYQELLRMPAEDLVNHSGTIGFIMKRSKVPGILEKEKQRVLLQKINRDIERLDTDMSSLWIERRPNWITLIESLERTLFTHFVMEHAPGYGLKKRDGAKFLNPYTVTDVLKILRIRFHRMSLDEKVHEINRLLDGIGSIFAGTNLRGVSSPLRTLQQHLQLLSRSAGSSQQSDPSDQEWEDWEEHWLSRKQFADELVRDVKTVDTFRDKGFLFFRTTAGGRNEYSSYLLPACEAYFGRRTGANISVLNTAKRRHSNVHARSVKKKAVY